MPPAVFMMQRALTKEEAFMSITSLFYTQKLLEREEAAMLILEIKLMALSLIWVGLYLLQRVLVGKRRCSRHWLVQYGAMAAYYLPVPLVFYAAQAVYSTSHIDKDAPFLHLKTKDIPFLLAGISRMFHLCVPVQENALLVTNMRAYSLHDHPRDRYNSLMWIVLLGCIELGRAQISFSIWPGLLQLVEHTGIYFVTAWTILSANTSDSTLDCQTKAVADYMKRESMSSSTSPFFDDHTTFDCCRYPFVQGKDGEWVTIRDLVQRDDLPNDRYIWLSYSLSRLLARRYYGFHCAEEGDDKVRCFALVDLRRTNDYKRAFTIVEVQLAFLHDYFFTASLPIVESGPRYILAAQDMMFKFTSVIGSFLIVFSTRASMVMSMVTMLLSLMGGLIIVFPKFFPMLLIQHHLAIYWSPIHTAFHKLDFTPPAVRTARLFHSRPNPDEQDAFDQFQNGVYWRNKIGQYSVLHDYDRRRSLKKALVAWFKEIMLSQPSYKFIKHLPVEEEEVNMLELDNMRELVASTLWDTHGQPTNGTKSLKKNRTGADYDWLWTCREETHTDTILIWHIATSYCDMTPISDDRECHRDAARALSRYCAYLVAFLPEFLPEHSLATKQVFQRVIQEAQQELGTKPMKDEEKLSKIRGLQLPDQHEQRTTFHKGVELGRQLEMLSDDNIRWKVIAEFWAETILYIAPSDNAEAHIEHLAKGGEFITHLWAMLSNAGILKRAEGEWHPPPVVAATEEPPTHQLLEAMSSSSKDGPSTSAGPSPPIQTSELAPNENYGGYRLISAGAKA